MSDESAFVDKRPAGPFEVQVWTRPPSVQRHPLPPTPISASITQTERQGLRGLFALECASGITSLSVSLYGCLINMTDTIAQSLHVNTAHSHSYFITLIYSVEPLLAGPTLWSPTCFGVCFVTPLCWTLLKSLYWKGSWWVSQNSPSQLNPGKNTGVNTCAFAALWSLSQHFPAMRRSSVIYVLLLVLFQARHVLACKKLVFAFHLPPCIIYGIIFQPFSFLLPSSACVWGNDSDAPI